MRRSTFFTFLGLVIASLPACGGSVEGDAPAPSVDEHHPRFVGTWHFTERAARGGYAMAIWDLGANGELTLHASEAYGGDAAALGGVVRARDGVSCRLGRGWSSIGSDRLRFAMTCTDGLDRLVTYRFPADASRNGIDPDPALEDVAGERTGWSAQDGWGFRMRKCTSLATCR